MLQQYFTKSVSTPLKLVLIYLILSGLWIAFSDAVVTRIAGTNYQFLQEAQSLKRVFFVVASALIFYLVIKRFYDTINRSLKTSEELLDRYKALSEATKEGIADHDLVNDEAVINQQLQDSLGLNSLEIAAFSLVLEEKTHPDDRERIAQSMRSTIQSAQNIWRSELRLLWNDGTYHDVIFSGHLIRDENTLQAIRFISAFQDVSEVRHIQTRFYQKQLKQKQSLGITIIKAQEEERNRWAQELHDNICQVLTVSKLYLEEITTMYPDQLIVKTKDMVQGSLNDIRQLSASLKPPAFGSINLHESIEELHGNIARVSTFRFLLRTEELDEGLLNEDHKLMIYRIVQEQLNNITKYAEAREVRVQLWNNDNQFFIKVTDDGVGCNIKEVKSGIGLRNIQNRLQVFNGSMHLEGAPGHGCTLEGSFEI
ncbi:MAG: histidine kinase [Chitinophagaceae bacterium]